MDFSGSTSSDNKLDLDSSDDLDSFCDDISSIPSCSGGEYNSSPWTRALYNEGNTYQTPPKSTTHQCTQVHHENLKLKQKIKQLEDTLKKKNSKNPWQCNIGSSGFTQSTSWLLHQSPSTANISEDEIMIVRNLEKEFSNLEFNDNKEEGFSKRGRNHFKTQKPKKFIKLAFMSSIGTLKF